MNKLKNPFSLNTPIVFKVQRQLIMISKTQELLDKKEKVLILSCIPKKKSHCAYNIFGQQNICNICNKNKNSFFQN